MNYYNEIKNELINNEINRSIKYYSINRSDLTTYFNVGKMLSEAGKQYGEDIIGKYSKKLSNELGKNYSITTLKRFRKYYLLFKNEKGATLSHQLTWSHIQELLSLNDMNIIDYYLSISIERNLSVRQLREKIKNNEYERLPEITKIKLKNKEKTNLKDFVKEPIIIRNTNTYELISEKVLQKLILEDISTFLKELGEGFCFISNEYKIMIGNQYNYIDLLLYNIKYKCYVVVELKVTSLNKNHIGQIQIYMNYIDKNVKSIYESDTVGIIICKKNNQYIIDYCSDDRIISKEYKLM